MCRSPTIRVHISPLNGLEKEYGKRVLPWTKGLSVMITLLLATAHRGVTVERYDASSSKGTAVFSPRLRFSLVDFNPGGVLPTGRRPPHDLSQAAETFTSDSLLLSIH